MSKKKTIENLNDYRNPEFSFGDDNLLDWDERDLSTELIDATKKSPGMDKPFLIISMVILLIGVIMVLSASFARGFYMTSQPLGLFLRQLVFAVTGIALMLVVSRFSVRTISRWSMQLLLVSIVLLVLVLVIGVRVGGARRWIGLGGTDASLRFQPSEVVKLAIILAFAQMSCKLGDARMKTFKFGVLPFAIVTGITVLLLRFQPHLSAMIIIVALTAIMMFAGGTRLRWFILALMILASMIGGFIFFQLRSVEADIELGDVSMETIRENVDFSGMGYEGRRIGAWLDPNDDPLNAGFQIRQSLNAVGSGGLLGLGLGQSRQKHL